MHYCNGKAQPDINAPSGKQKTQRTDSILITWFQMCHSCSHFDNGPGSFVPQHHGVLHDKISNSTMLPVVNVRTTDPNRMHPQEDLCQKGTKGSMQKSLPSLSLEETQSLSPCPMTTVKPALKYSDLLELNKCARTLFRDRWHIHETC